MSLAQVVNLVAVDVDQIIQLYHQLYDTPPEVRELFQLVETIYSTLRNTESIIAERNVSVLFDDYVSRFKNFRNTLLDLELFIDPQQSLPRSGSGFNDRGVQPWTGPRDSDSIEFCNSFRKCLDDLNQSCSTLVSIIPR
jgi:hypothetical protein